MRVLHLSLSDRLDSVSRSALQLHRKLRGRGVETRMLVKKLAAPDEAGVGKVEAAAGGSNPFLISQRACFDTSERSATDSAFEIAYPGTSVAGHRAVAESDLIHLHQVAGFLSPMAIRELLALGKPVVWSLPDAWPFTGGCFHTGTCLRFGENCAGCPQLNGNDLSLPPLLLSDKAAFLAGVGNLTPVAPNPRLAGLMRRSLILRGMNVETIAPDFFDATANPKPANASEPLRFVVFCEGLAAARDARALRAILEAAQTLAPFGGW